MPRRVPKHLLSTLIALAEHADPQGLGAYRRLPDLAARIGKSPRTAARNLAELEERGFIRRGSQRLASHLPAKGRPVVYDLLVRPEVTA